MFIVYDVLFLIFAFFYFPYLLVRKKWHRGFLLRFGLWPNELIRSLMGKKNIWIHAVSVGEVMAIFNLIQEIKNEYADYQIVCSTVTKTGYHLADQKLGKENIVIYAPLDFSFTVRKFIQWIKPHLYISAETEIWPNLYLALGKSNIPVLLVNGRISNKAYAGYKRIKYLIRKILNNVQMFCMQSQADVDRIIDLGAISNRVLLTGNLKFENVLSNEQNFENKFGFDDKDELLVAGSTHPGEEEIIIRVYKKLYDEYPNLHLVIAPRHIERCPEVVRLVADHGLSPVKFSERQQILNTQKSVMIIDTIGHLPSLYKLAKIVFVGKSLTAKGGQNIIEPAYFGKPIFTGPYTDNFKDVVQIFLKEDALIQVKDSDELFNEMRSLLKDSERLEEVGNMAKDIVEKNQGATTLTMKAVRDLLQK